MYGRLEGCRGLHERETRSQGMIRSSRRWEVQKQQGRSEGVVSDRRQVGSEGPVGAIASRLFVRFFSSIEGRPGNCVREGATPADPAVLDNPCDFDRRTRPLGVLYCRGPRTLVKHAQSAPWDSGGRSRRKRLSWGSGRSRRNERESGASGPGGETMMAHSFSLVRPLKSLAQGREGT